MRFKSEKSSSRNCFSTSATRGFRRALCALALLAFPTLASATITITPVNTDQMSEMENYFGTTYYYPAVTDPDIPFNGAIDSTNSTTPSKAVNLEARIDSDTDREDLIYFRVTSDVDVTTTVSGETVVLALYAAGSAGKYLVPIGWAEGSACVTGSPTCQGFDTVGGVNYALAVKYTPKQSILIGLYPADICRYFTLRNNSVSLTGCTGSTVSSFPGSGSNLMTLTFTITTAPSATAAPTTSATNTGGTSTPASTPRDEKIVSLAFETASPLLACPTISANSYFPGDGRVFLDTRGFGTSSAVPLSAVMVVARRTEDITQIALNEQFRSANEIAVAVPPERQEAEVSGFVNTTDGSDNRYSMSFFTRNVSGVLAFPTSAAACGITGVQSAEIQGFLRESKCFIATAAFRSGRAVPVLLLREFRDRILLQSKPGQAFVNWYYDWSPRAANWLLEHPGFRYPVLVMLAPLIAVAWLALHPWVALGIALCGLCAGVGGIRGIRSRRSL